MEDCTVWLVDNFRKLLTNVRVEPEQGKKTHLLRLLATIDPVACHVRVYVFVNAGRTVAQAHLPCSAFLQVRDAAFWRKCCRIVVFLLVVWCYAFESYTLQRSGRFSSLERLSRRESPHWLQTLTAGPRTQTFSSSMRHLRLDFPTAILLGPRGLVHPVEIGTTQKVPSVYIYTHAHTRIHASANVWREWQSVRCWRILVVWHLSLISQYRQRKFDGAEGFFWTFSLASKAWLVPVGRVVCRCLHSVPCTRDSWGVSVWIGVCGGGFHQNPDVRYCTCIHVWMCVCMHVCMRAHAHTTYTHSHLLSHIHAHSVGQARKYT